MIFLACMFALMAFVGAPLWLPFAVRGIAPWLPVFNPRLRLVLSLLDHPGWADAHSYPPRIRHPHGVEVEYHPHDFPVATSSLTINGASIKLGWIASLRLAAAYRRWQATAARAAEDQALAELAQAIIEREGNVTPIRKTAA